MRRVSQQAHHLSTLPHEARLERLAWLRVSWLRKGRRPRSFHMNPGEQAIRELHSTWIAAVNAGDLEKLLAMLADDVVLINPGGEPIGREGFIAVFSGAHRQFQIHCVSELQEVVVVGDVAYTWARDSLAITPRVSENETPRETTHFAGHRLTVYRKSSDGRWLLARDAHTLSPVEK